MELQWPLIVFTTFIAWAAGVFGTQCLYQIKGKGEKTQFVAWVTAAVLLVIGGVSVFLHLANPLRIFNGFGHLSSGITQELIAIIVVAILALVFMILLKKNGAVPNAYSGVCIAGCVILVCVMGHSYMMAARPSWDTVFQVLSLVGAGCVLGPATIAFEAAVVTKDESDFSLSNMVGSIINAATTIIYVIAIVVAGGSFYNMGYYFDPTRSVYGMKDIAEYSAFSGDAAPFTVVAIVLALVAVACAFLGKKQGWKIMGIVIVVCGVAAAICLRIVLYITGGSVFLLY